MSVIEIEMEPDIEHPELIIGRETIKKFNLMWFNRSQFFNQDTTIMMEWNKPPDLKEIELKSLNIKEIVDTSYPTENNKSSDKNVLFLLNHVQVKPTEGYILPKNSLLSLLPPESVSDTISIEGAVTNDTLRTVVFTNKAGETLTTFINTNASLEYEMNLISLLKEFSDRFALSLPFNHRANLPPMTLEVDKPKWYALKDAKTPPRKQSDSRDEEIQKQVNQMLGDGRIRISTASSWSQVHLAAKPDKSWRFCIDYRWLNFVTVFCEGF
jgi:hypothetical protein